MSNRKKLGIDFGRIDPNVTQEERIQYINFKLAAMGLKAFRRNDTGTPGYLELFDDIIQDYREKTRMVDLQEISIWKRIDDFFTRYFVGHEAFPRVITNTFTLDHYGLARELSLPPDGNTFENEYVNSYRIKQGILNNPRNDRRTTKGSFHIVEGGLSIPGDKKSVPMQTFLKLYEHATNPPEALQILPFTSKQPEPSKTFVSLLIKPTVSPEVSGISKEKTMEVLFVAPGSLVSNLDFVESVFGNAGDPGAHINDSGLDLEGWSGHTGYILLAPHLTKLKKIELGLPHFDEATERQKLDGMCYRDEEELYNEGQAFKLTCRDQSGVCVTIIADNYYGYSKKEIKTQISFAANLYGNVEEEHAGGTIAFPRKNLGEHYRAVEDKSILGYTFEENASNYQKFMTVHESGYAIDKNYESIIYLPENVEIDLKKTRIEWQNKGKIETLKLLPDKIYVLPNGDKLQIERHPEAPTWKLVYTDAEGTFCHKPCTVSGGGKSEISKSIDNAIIYGTYFVHDLQKDLDHVEQILNYDYRKRWKEYPDRTRPSRPILSVDRTLGSVIKLLSPSSAYSDEFNAYIESIPNHVKSLVFMVKRFYRESWGEDWRKHFTVDYINGKPGNEINFDGRKVRPSYLRVGFGEGTAWRIFKLRMDFMPSEKLQMEDDVTASILIPADKLSDLAPGCVNSSLKFVSNCEYRFFQRPDDAIYKGYDKQAELDLSSDNLFATNFEPLDKAQVLQIREDVMNYIHYTDPVKALIEDFLVGEDQYCIISSEPRIVDGAPSKNPRYLEHRKDFIRPIANYVAEVGVRFSRKIPLSRPVLMPVNAILPGRRNNPPGEENGKKIPPLSVYNPLHYQELPELFMDFISSLTGKSPSTTGAGSEGALTKGPFNMLLPIYDLNSALLSYILGDYNGFTTPAGHIGPNTRVDHDISILIPELWSRLTEAERDPYRLIYEGSFEKLEDFEYHGKVIPASRLGYRMTEAFSYKYFGKIFDEPQTVFDEMLLKPEKQDLDAFVDGIMNITNGHKKAALEYFNDGSIEYAIPPLKAILHIMAYGTYEHQAIESEAVRGLFTRENVLNSDWYNERIKAKQQGDIKNTQKIIDSLEAFIKNPINRSIIDGFGYREKLDAAKKRKDELSTESYYQSMIGMIGAEPSLVTQSSKV